MLILTRKVGESINIGDDITITILGVSGQQYSVAMTEAAPSLRRCGFGHGYRILLRAYKCVAHYRRHCQM